MSKLVIFDSIKKQKVPFEVNSYEVIMTKNFTDIDDKIIKKMYETNQSLDEITTQYINAYKADMKALNVLDNTLEPKATKNLDAMKNMIENLLSKDIAYKTSNGVYFDTSKDDSYGSLSKKFDEENSQARVEENKEKRNAADFALWKYAKEQDVSFDSTFGEGRPGWHIECSAMIQEHLAYDNTPYQIDIHAGGADLLFPHHENEAAQSRCSSNHQELAKYWMHNGFVNIDGEKMSKSLGNSFFLKDVLKSYSGEIIRFYLLTAHYKTDFNFNEEDLISSKKRLDKLYRLKKRVYGSASSTVNKTLQEELLNSLNDDLNTSKAIASIDEMINTANEKLNTNPKDKNLKKELIANFAFIDEILGFGNSDAYEYFQFGIDEATKNKIETLIKSRNEAKKAKDFETADKVRDELNAMDISIMDTPNGVVWEKN